MSANAAGVVQSVDAWASGPGLRAYELVDNSGTINAMANATADNVSGGSWAFESAVAQATGVYQYAEDVGFGVVSDPDSGVATLSVVNSGTINAHAMASASLTVITFNYLASRRTPTRRRTASGRRSEDAPTAHLSVDNTGGTINATAQAKVFGTTNISYAGAFAGGVYQSIDAWIGAAGPEATATCRQHRRADQRELLRHGHRRLGHGGRVGERGRVWQYAEDALTVSDTVLNSGTIDVSGVAHANGGTTAWLDGQRLGLCRQWHGLQRRRRRLSAARRLQHRLGACRQQRRDQCGGARRCERRLGECGDKERFRQRHAFASRPSALRSAPPTASPST